MSKFFYSLIFLVSGILSFPLHAQLKHVPIQHKLWTTGTSFAIDRSGIWLTNNHVVENCKGIWLQPYQDVPQTFWKANVIHKTSNPDIAILQTIKKPSGSFYISEKFPVNNTSGLISFGYPHGTITGMRTTLKNQINGYAGPASAPYKWYKIQRDGGWPNIKTNIQGMSGGPWLYEGKVAGIMTAMDKKRGRKMYFITPLSEILTQLEKAKIIYHGSMNLAKLSEKNYHKFAKSIEKSDVISRVYCAKY